MDSTFSLPDKMLSNDKTLSVHFACQRCCQPLKLHDSFPDLDDQTLSELTVPLYPNTDVNEKINLIEAFNKKCEDSSVSRKMVLPVNVADSSYDFMVVGNLNGINLDKANSLKITSALFDIMSDQSDVDHPLCEECTDNLLDQMDQQLRTAEDECKEYRDFLERLDMGNEEDDCETLQADLLKLQAEEAELESKLYEMEEKEKTMKEVLKDCENEYESLQREEDKSWHEYCRTKRQLLLSEDNQRSVNNQLKYAQIQLDKLTKTNVFNATFHIWHNGHFGTINNFRLGRLPNVPVEWPEINAAWGQTVLLLHSLAKKIDLTFERFRLVPYGNQSYLESLDNKSKELPLYCFGGIRYMLDNKFDHAMVAFLDCLQQFKDKVEYGDASFHLPYRMEKGKIEDKSTSKSYSIKIQFNSEEQWTKALKFMLTNLKWALAWVSTQFHDT